MSVTPLMWIFEPWLNLQVTTTDVPLMAIHHHLAVIIHVTYSVVINDLGDNSDVTGRRSIVDEDDSADFDESLESGWLLGLEC